MALCLRTSDNVLSCVALLIHFSQDGSIFHLQKLQLLSPSVTTTRLRTT